MDRFIRNYVRCALAAAVTAFAVTTLLMSLIDNSPFQDEEYMTVTIAVALLTGLSVFLWGWALKRT